MNRIEAYETLSLFLADRGHTSVKRRLKLKSKAHKRHEAIRVAMRALLREIAIEEVDD